MYRNLTLSPSLMCMDWLNAGEELKKIEAHQLDYLHIDIMDGHFVPDFCMGSTILEHFERHVTTPFYYHLMVDEPAQVFDAFRKQEGDVFVIHKEACKNLHRDILTLKKTPGLKVGVALSPATGIDTLEYVIDDLDFVLLLTVNPGYKGQPFIPQILRKIEKLKTLLTRLKLNVQLTVDGNVNPSIIPDLVAAGATDLVLGTSGLFRQDCSFEESLQQIKISIDEGCMHV